MSCKVPGSYLAAIHIALVVSVIMLLNFDEIGAAPEAINLQANYQSSPVMWCWSGAITTKSFRVNARLIVEGGVSRLVVSTQPELGNPLYSTIDTALAATNNRVVSHLITDLSPNTHYYYGFETNGVVDYGVIGRAKTFPDGPGSFTLGVASCATTGSQHTVFQTIRSLHPDFFIHTGDFHYEDISVNDVSRFRSAYDRVLASTTQSAMFREAPIMYMWDDHDFGPNNSDSTAPGRLAARITYQEYLPHYPLAFGSGDISINYTFGVGRVFFIVCDSRSARSPAYSPDNASKTMLGGAQKAWFKQQLLLANGKYPLIVWVNTLPWIGTTGDDGWYLYPTERREIADFIKANAIRGLCQLSGDAHMLAIDNGTNSDYATGGGAGFPVMQAAALDRSPSLKGGPYSEGAYPGTGQFGLMSVVDNGDSIITVSWRGLNHSLTEIVQYSFTVPVRRMVCGDADSNGSADIFDAVYLINYIFRGGPAPSPLLLGDVNCSNTLNISDAVYLIAYIFSGGFAPCMGCEPSPIER